MMKKHWDLRRKIAAWFLILSQMFCMSFLYAEGETITNFRSESLTREIMVDKSRQDFEAPAQNKPIEQKQFLETSPLSLPESEKNQGQIIQQTIYFYEDTPSDVEEKVRIISETYRKLSDDEEKYVVEIVRELEDLITRENIRIIQQETIYYENSPEPDLVADIEIKDELEAGEIPIPNELPLSAYQLIHTEKNQAITQWYETLPGIERHVFSEKYQYLSDYLEEKISTPSRSSTDPVAAHFHPPRKDFLIQLALAIIKEKQQSVTVRLSDLYYQAKERSKNENLPARLDDLNRQEKYLLKNNSVQGWIEKIKNSIFFFQSSQESLRKEKGNSFLQEQVYFQAMWLTALIETRNMHPLLKLLLQSKKHPAWMIRHLPMTQQNIRKKINVKTIQKERSFQKRLMAFWFKTEEIRKENTSSLSPERSSIFLFRK